VTLSGFPRTARYDRDWVRRNSLGENPLAQTEALCRTIPIGPGSRVLDLGCGRAASSIFLAREFGAQVWAADKSVSPTENFARIRSAGCESLVFPIQADARDLPFPREFFDAVLAIDSYYYFGTDERYLPYLLEFVREGGFVGIADIALAREIPTADDAPDFLRETFAAHWSFVHTVEWWRGEWERTGLVDVIAADVLPGSRELLREYSQDRLASRRQDEIARAAALDGGDWLLLFSLVGRKIAKELSRS
jgi:cyclopropane fatty-acyl-phospholipid synthase-like methyltransferase